MCQSAKKSSDKDTCNSLNYKQKMTHSVHKFVT